MVAVTPFMRGMLLSMKTTSTLGTAPLPLRRIADGGNGVMPVNGGWREVREMCEGESRGKEVINKGEGAR